MASLRYKKTQGHRSYLRYLGQRTRILVIQRYCRTVWEKRNAEAAKRKPKAYCIHGKSKAVLQRAVGEAKIPLGD